MATIWPPSKESELVPWATNYSALITATPAAFSLLPADATALATALTNFTAALTLATNPATRTPVTVTNKDVAKAALLAEIRALAKRIQATATVTPGQKESLGLPIHKDTPTPIPAPATRPVLSQVGGSTDLSVTVRIVDEATPTKSAKPFGVDGAEFYSYVQTTNEEPPADLSLWRYEGIAKRATFVINYEGTDARRNAFVRAAWFNPRGEAGPVSAPIEVTIAA